MMDQSGGSDVSDEEQGIGFTSLRQPSGMKLGVGACIAVLVFLLFLLLSFSLRIVPPGGLGLVTTMGYVQRAALHPGMHVTNPVAKVKVFSARSTLFSQRNKVPTQEGLMVVLDVAVIFHIKPESAFNIYTTVGEDFVRILIAPMLASGVAGLTSRSQAKALYGVGRDLIQTHLAKTMRASLEPRGVVLESALLLGIQLSQEQRDAIEAKVMSEQAAERMKFVLQKAEQEAERKTIEAKGIQDFQKIIDQDITPELLQWKGIETTEQFSEAANTKLVIMGNSQASLPVMFSNNMKAEI